MKKFKKEIINDDEVELICKFIKLRHASNITQKELSEKVGVAQSTIARMENNMHSASLGLFTKILSEMGYKLEIVKKEN